MKIILVIIDGLGDEPIPALGNKTPLEAAKTPNLNWLASKGVCGLIEPWQLRKEKPASDTCHLALFGYDPKIYYLGRGPYEAAGIGMEMKKGDIALRTNFGTVDENLKIIDRRAGRIENTQSFIKALSRIRVKGVKFLIKKSYGHRIVLVLRGKDVSPAIADGDPHEIGKKVRKILPICVPRRVKKSERKKAEFTAQALNEFLEKAHKILKVHSLNKKREKQNLLPANYLLVRGAGEFRETPSFKEKHGLKAGCIAGGGLYKGIGKILGMDLIEVRGATGFANTNLKGKISAVKKSIRNHDFLFLHIKATDSLAEDGNYFGKKAFIEKIDKNLKPLLRLKNTLIAITGDHSTSSLKKRHCSRPFSFLIYSDIIEADIVREFSERACQKGGLGKVKQLYLMRKVLLYNK